MNTAMKPQVDPREGALCRGALYSALALGFGPPDGEVWDRLAGRTGVVALGWLFAETGLAGPEMDEVLRILEQTTPSVEAHGRIFGHTARGPVPPFETEYGADTLFHQPQELSDLSGFLNAFGLRLQASEHERVDHVRCECEFMAFLAMKEAYAVEHGDDAMLGETRKAGRLFLRDHLGRFTAAFTQRLLREDPAGFYGALARILRAFVEAECRRADVDPGDEALGLRLAAPEDSAPMLCGSSACGECPE